VPLLSRDAELHARNGKAGFRTFNLPIKLPTRSSGEEDRKRCILGLIHMDSFLVRHPRPKICIMLCVVVHDNGLNMAS
jgi:hypothetical protein